eukprot:CAMPEP_0206489586 /NCGR_PEP_ID=MMETSP0324_2-20121206/43364_1 /ASSEMBLY_ACC=CAM_ASM_000836 /TAXON_ID=2866 /ORGANISM="Crypthecodinium cohnii, Strain Seligo" /LENGTH=492 /DNA_ID=CAMNT_0053969365 /DNA_START=38 /DNA_END=1516 /DNA_ORIENTATION=-
MADVGIEYIRSTEKDLKKLQEEVTGLSEVCTRLKADITLEAKLRGGEVSALQHKFEGDLAAEVGTLRREAAEKVAQIKADSESFKQIVHGFFDEMTKEIRSIKEEMVERKSDISRLVQTSEATAKDLAATKAELATFMKDTTSQFADVTSQAVSDRDRAVEATRTVAHRMEEETARLDALVDAVKHTMETQRKVVAQEFVSLGERLDSVREFAATKAKEADMHAMEIRMHDNLDKHVRALNEELTRKEYCSNVKVVSDRLMTLTLDVNANDAKAKAGDEALAKQLAMVEQSLAKTNRQVDADRDRANEAWVSLERDCNLRATKIDFDASVVRLTCVESTLNPMVPTLATKVDNIEFKTLASRVLALEQVYPTKADASELPKLHLMLADTTAKHEGLHSKTQDHHTKLERLDDMVREHMSKLDMVENRTKEVHCALSAKADVETVHDKDTLGMMMRDYYRREEIDSMMTRVWWRVGDSCKSTRLPSPWHPGTQ